MAALAAIATANEGDAASAAGCAQCGAPVQLSARFCCAGCEAARAVIEGLGLDEFYQRRRADAAARPLTPEADRPDFARHVRSGCDGVARLDVFVDGLTCPACLWLIEAVLARVPEVTEARVNLGARRLRLAWRGGPERAGAIAEHVLQLGFRLVPFDPASVAIAQSAEETALLRALAVAGFAADRKCSRSRVNTPMPET